MFEILGMRRIHSINGPHTTEFAILIYPRATCPVPHTKNVADRPLASPALRQSQTFLKNLLRPKNVHKTGFNFCFHLYLLQERRFYWRRAFEPTPHECATATIHWIFKSELSHECV